MLQSADVAIRRSCNSPKLQFEVAIRIPQPHPPLMLRHCDHRGERLCRARFAFVARARFRLQGRLCFDTPTLGCYYE